MKQSTVRALLSRLTEQLVLYFSEDGKISDTKEFSERLALSTWEGLILLLRQSIANSDEVLLEEVGLFRKVDDRWFFEPAASLVEVDAMKLEAAASHVYLAQKALFHLQQGSSLLANVADDQELPSQPEAETSEMKLLGAMFGADAVNESKLSDRIDLIGTRLIRTARRLRGDVDTGRIGTFNVRTEVPTNLGDAGFENARSLDAMLAYYGRERETRKQTDKIMEAYKEAKRLAELTAQSSAAEAGQTES